MIKLSYHFCEFGEACHIASIESEWFDLTLSEMHDDINVLHLGSEEQ